MSHLARIPAVSVRFDDVVDQVVERERAEGVSVGGDHRQSVAVSLHHVHIPRLAEAGVLEYDRRSRTIRYNGDDALERCLAATTEPASW